MRGARDFLCIYHSEEDVRSLSPDMSLLAGLDRMGVIVTAPARAMRDEGDRVKIGGRAVTSLAGEIAA